MPWKRPRPRKQNYPPPPSPGKNVQAIVLTSLLEVSMKIAHYTVNLTDHVTKTEDRARPRHRKFSLFLRLVELQRYVNN